MIQSSVVVRLFYKNTIQHMCQWHIRFRMNAFAASKNLILVKFKIMLSDQISGIFTESFPGGDIFLGFSFIKTVTSYLCFTIIIE
jgi:hypothetical protein